MDISVQYGRVFSVCVQVIVSGAAGSRRDVAVFSACTLSAAGSGQSPAQADRAGQPEDSSGQPEDGAGQREDGAVGGCLRWLIEHEFVR